ncbi:hypothetical protein CI109_105004 [Kwoniella shandongensis]|uniref:Uncharacterized protein n=1 Tax=Kwoniella shandongensis TaxID=1734106 RepID=A0A5M6BWR6_9TREE|nr:uncharacterized protein CI109_004399 [Kwoniella shandongensis]KAA5527338.1 hypothetical protein CI109_004399 [Kwoniella shandongensis]
MSLRTQTHPYFAPRFTSSPTSSSSYRPITSSSRAAGPAAQNTHQDLLSPYQRRDSSKTAAAEASRLGSKRSVLSWRRSNGHAHARRLSAVLEEGSRGYSRSDKVYDDDRDKGRRRRRYFASLLFGPSGQIFSRRARRYIVYAIGIFFLYLTILRPILNSTLRSSSPAVGAASSGLKSLPTPHSVSGRITSTSLKQEVRRPRAPLPRSVLDKRTKDHKVEGGLLKVNPDSLVHPIYELIRDAREEWDKKVARQSTTLKEAVVEYRRRYGRQPPKGFDKWWAYVCENNVQLPDEYDQIHTDLLPFRALSPRDLNARINAATRLPDTYTLRVRKGSLRTLSTYDSKAIEGANERLEGQTELIRPIAKFLGDITVVYSVHDTATAVVGYDHKRELLEHVEEGEWFDEDDEIDMTLQGWSAACSPNSPIRTFDSNISPPSILPNTSIAHKSFISSHSTTMDLCTNPSLIPIHGALAGKSPKVRPLTPIFSLSKTSLHSDVLGVPVEQWVNTDDLPDVPWEEKTEDKLMWRGSNTGAYHSAYTPWRASHRTRLVKMANMISSSTNTSTNNHWEQEQGGSTRDRSSNPSSETVEILPNPKDMKSQKLKEGSKRYGWSEVNDKYMNLAFTGGPLQCNVDDGTCDDLATEYAWSKLMTHDDALQYRYIVDVDGNAWSARFKRLLSSGSLIFKSTIMPEWWTDRIQPWVHYVPVQMDYSDLYDIMAFFQGDPSTPSSSASASETPLAHEIALSGKEWSATHWRKENMIAYVFRPYLEWGRLMADRRGEMDLVYDEKMEEWRHSEMSEDYDDNDEL